MSHKLSKTERAVFTFVTRTLALYSMYVGFVALVISTTKLETVPWWGYVLAVGYLLGLGAANRCIETYEEPEHER